MLCYVYINLYNLIIYIYIYNFLLKIAILITFFHTVKILYIFKSIQNNIIYILLNVIL